LIDPQKYKSGRDFRQALDVKLKAIAAAQNMSGDDLRRQVVFNRFLSRLDYTKFVLTGGYSLELRLPLSRSTTDIDLYAREAKLIAINVEEQNQAILLALREQAEKDLNDYFSFDVERVLGRLHGPKEGGVRCLIVAKLNDREYYKFHVDVAICPTVVLEPETVTSQSLLAFFEKTAVEIKAVQKEELFANKIHAYTRARQTENSRVEDLVDMALLIDAGLDTEKTLSAMQKVFADSHNHKVIPEELATPPVNWHKDFNLIAERRNLDMSMLAAFDCVKEFYRQLAQ
jgi:hypothetical protein